MENEECWYEERLKSYFEQIESWYYGFTDYQFTEPEPEDNTPPF